MNNPEKILLHHSLTKDGEVKDFDAIKRYHIETNGWKDIGYHWIIEKVNGKVVVIKGRDESIEGAQCKEQGMNRKSIGICFVGNYDLGELPQDMFVVGVELVKDIRKRYGNLEIEPHSKYATYKTCPGKMFQIDKFIKACEGKDYSGRWSEKYIDFAIKQEIMSGYPDGSFLPTKALSREEMATIIYKLLNRLEENK